LGLLGNAAEDAISSVGANKSGGCWYEGVWRRTEETFDASAALAEVADRS
jgi:hypothetical protein